MSAAKRKRKLFTDYVILLDRYNFQFEKVELSRIARMHNANMHYKDIAKQLKRPGAEIILALLHIADSREVDIVPLGSIFAKEE